jgi:ATP-dependent Lon protease
MMSLMQCCDCREAGVRSLKKLLEKIYRKSALTLVKRGGPGVLPDTPNSSGPAGAATEAGQQPGERATLTSPDSGSDAASPASGHGHTAGVSESADAASTAGADSQQPEVQLPDASPQVNRFSSLVAGLEYSKATG